MGKDNFGTYHPIINFVYFVFVIGCSMFLRHPVFLGISCVSGFIYYIYLKGKKAFKTALWLMIPVFLISALVNPLFNHEGVTLLFYFRTGNPLTLESIVYGLASGVMLVSVLNWFSCYQVIMTSDKFIYLFGKLIPAMSLILSMVLRFVPKFKNQIEKVSRCAEVYWERCDKWKYTCKGKTRHENSFNHDDVGIGKFSGDSRFHEVERIWTAWQN